MRKAISTALAASIALPVMLSFASGCVTASAEDSITNGELIVLINNTFGFEGFDSQEPYFESVPSDSRYFSDIQTAVEFGVIDELVTDIDPNAAVTREFFAMAASGAINDDRTQNVTISDASEITYLDDVLTVLNLGLMELDGGKFVPDKKMSASECILLADEARQIWATCTVDAPLYEVSLAENVVDFTGMELYSYDPETDEVIFDDAAFNELQKKMSDNNFKYENGAITVDSAEAFGISEGTILIIPGNDGESSAVKVTSVKKNSDGTCTLSTEAADPEEAVQNYNVEQKITPDLSQAVFYDANGNVVEYVSEEEANALLSSYSKKAPAQLIGGGRVDFASAQKAEIADTGKINVSKGGVSVALDTPLGPVGLTVSKNSIKLNTSILLGKNDNGSCTLSCGQEFNNISFDYKAKTGLFEKKYLKFVMNYTTVEKLGIKGNYAKSITVGHFDYPTGIGDLTVKMDINLQINFDGELNVSLTNAGRSTGMEYRNHKLSFICTDGRQTIDVNGKAKVELTVPVDVSVSAIFGLLKAGVVITPGIGAKMNIETTQIETGKANPSPLICTQVDAYPIFRIKIYGKVIINFKPYTKEILGENNVAFSLHFELFESLKPELVEKCTKDDRQKQAADKETAQAGVTVGENLKLSVNQATIDKDQTFTVRISEMPSGYTYEDIGVINSNADVISTSGKALVSTAFKKSCEVLTGYSYDVTGISEGKAVLTFGTKDGKYRATCNVTVVDSSISRDYSIKLTTYGTSIGVGSKSKIEIEKLPDQVSENEIIWYSSDASVVRVDQYGNITGMGKGSAIIYAETPNKKSTAACSVNVNEAGNVSMRFLPFGEAAEIAV